MKASNMKVKTQDDAIFSREMRALEVNAEYFGINMLQLMENAGRIISQETISRLPDKRKIVIFCGLGGNGGDGFVAARHLFDAGYSVTVVLAGKSRDINHESALQNWSILQSLQDLSSQFPGAHFRL